LDELSSSAVTTVTHALLAPGRDWLTTGPDTVTLAEVAFTGTRKDFSGHASVGYAPAQPPLAPTTAVYPTVALAVISKLDTGPFVAFALAGDSEASLVESSAPMQPAALMLASTNRPATNTCLIHCWTCFA